jgi:predicted NAD/FAD-dependent oxidoreductase
MLGFEESFDLGFDAAYVGKADISFVSVNSSKPKRKSSMSVVINSTNKFAEENLEKNQEEILSYLVQYSSNLLNIDLTKAKHKDLQRWRYANCPKQKSEHYSYFDFESKIGVIGDFCIQGRVECAFLSAQDLFKKFKQLILI